MKPSYRMNIGTVFSKDVLSSPTFAQPQRAACLLKCFIKFPPVASIYMYSSARYGSEQ